MKSQVLKTVKSFPDQVDIEELMQKIIVLGKISLGKQDLDSGRVHSHTDIKKHFGLQ